jgi:hypothetical protein
MTDTFFNDHLGVQIFSTIQSIDGHITAKQTKSAKVAQVLYFIITGTPSRAPPLSGQPSPAAHPRQDQGVGQEQSTLPQSVKVP